MSESQPEGVDPPQHRRVASDSYSLNLADSLAYSDDLVPPPAYGDSYGEILNEGDGIGTRAHLTDDGRVNIRIQQKTRGLADLLLPALRGQLDLTSSTGPQPPPYRPQSPIPERTERLPPRLNIVVQVVGSRGDVQPFVALGKVLREQYGHRVRLATHPTFKDFVEQNGLEFFSIAGDPAELMAFMVKNPGLMPGFDTLRRGDIGKRRRDIGNMIKRCWRSCIEGGDGSGVEASDSNAAELQVPDGGDPETSKPRPFIADAIIANPPSFAHIHCAEKLGIPLHVMFTMPWSPTQAFPHPLANVTSSNADTSMTNFVSYALVDMMTWQGLGDVINRFRQKTLGLEPISTTWAPGMIARMRIPFTYCWSPALIPKPRDWGSHISISGFYFLDLGSNFTPEPALAAFLDSGPPPVYIGFGSIVVDDPDAMTKLIFDAVKQTGQRALVSKGWGGFGAEEIGIPDGVFMLGNVPHDWLFKRVSCVVHHGGAGTTAAGIACGKPTVIVPFFGDQPFWGAMVAKAGAGPKPIHHTQLTADNLAESIQFALKPESLEKARKLAEKIGHERGSESGAQSFHKELGVDHMRCLLSPTRTAVWRIRRTEVRLSAFVVAVLANSGLLKLSDLKLYRPREHYTEDEPFDPITGGATALMGTMGSMAMGIADMPVAALKALKIHPDAPRSRSNSKPDAPGGIESPREPGTPQRSRGNTATSAPQSPPLLSPQRPANLSRSPSPVGTSQKLETAHEIINRLLPQRANLNNEDAQEQPQVDQDANEVENKKQPFSFDDAVGTGKGVSRIVSAGIKSPMDFTLGLARGFRNAPKLYGDQTVRKPEKVTGFSSGLKVAGKEFGHGFIDGISGLVTQPIEGAKKEGMPGFLKGVGMGIGGVVFKPSAAIWGIPGYTSQGIYKELQKRFGPSVDNWIIASRTAQGYEDFNQSNEQERAAIITRWKEMKPYIRKKKTFAEEERERLNSFRERGASAVNRAISRSPAGQPSLNGSTPSDSKAQTNLSRTDTSMTDESFASSVWTPVSLRSLSRASTTTDFKVSVEEPEDEELNEAIRRSVQETSRGDAEEDAAIEQAIRQSIADLESRKAQGASDAELRQAMQASLEDAEEGLSASRGGESESGNETETEDDGGLALALKESLKAEQTRQAEEEKAQREEDIVMNYMMRQSQAEDEMRKSNVESDKHVTS